MSNIQKAKGSISEVAKAIKDLSAEQAVYRMELADCSEKEMIAAMRKNKLSQADIKASLAKRASTTATITDKAATDADTASKYANLKVTNLLKVAWSKFTAFAMANPWLVAITATIAGLTALYAVVDHFTLSLEEAKEKLETTESELESVNQQIEELNTQIKTLESLETPSITDKEDLERLKAENEELRIRQRYLEKQKQNDEKDVSDTAKHDYKVKYGSTSREDIDNRKNALSNPVSSGGTASSYLTGGTATSTTPYAAGQQAQETEEYDKLADLIAQYELYSEKKKEAIANDDAESLAKYNEKLGDVETELMDCRTELQGFADDIALTGDSQDLENVKGDLALIDETLFSAGERLVDYVNNTLNATDTEKLTELAKNGELTADVLKKNFLEVDEYLKKNGLTLEDLISILDLYQEELENIPDKTGNLSTEELNKNINTAFDSIKKSHSALQEFKEAMSNGMTESALDGVAGLSDELKALVAEFHAGTVSADELYSALTEHYNTDLENYGKALIEKNQDNAEFYNRVGLNDSDFVNHMLENYKVDLSNCKDYNQARTEIELKTIRTLGDMWSKYYNIQTDTYTSQLNSLAQSAYGAARAGVSDEDNEALQLYKQITGQVTNYRNAIKELENIAYNGIESSFEGIGGGSSSSKSSSKTTFDWIETKISRIQRQISNFGKTVSATWLSWSTRNNALLSELSAVNEEIVTQKQAYEKYLSLANSVGLSEPYKSLVQSGGLRIDTITDENLKEKIQLYQDYYEKHLDALDAYNEGATTLAEKTREQFDLAASEYDSYISTVTSKADILNAYIDQVEARGHMVSKSYYEELKKVEQSNISSLQSKYSQLTSILNNAVANGTIKKGSEEYNNMKSEIDGVQQALIEANTALIEYDNTMRDLDWEVFDKIQDKISGVIEEADFLIDLMSDEKMFDGGITEYGQATMGLHAINYETYMNQSKKYGEELLEINKQLADDPNNWTLIERKEELIELQRESILAAQDEQQAILDLKQEGYDELLDSLDSAIEKYNELMDAERDLYDYEKSVSEQTSNIASLRKQIIAYSGDNSESAKSKIQQITVDLEKAEQELQETEMDKNIQDRQQLLTALKDEAELFVSEKMDNQDQILKEVIADTNIHIDAIKDTLDSQTSSVGTALSEEMNKIFGEGSSFVSIESTISTTLTDIKNLIQSMSSGNNATNGSSSGGNTNISSTPSTSAPTVSSTPSTPSTTNVSNGSSASGKWGSWFIPKSDSFPKEKLRTEVSIVDRLKSLSYDSSFDARASYYAAMGGSGEYRGSASQNTWMIAEMKKHGYRTGGTIGSLIKSTGEDGFVLARTGEEILSLDKIKELGFTFEKMKPIVDTMKYLPNLTNNTSNVTNAPNITVDMSGMQVVANDPDQFAKQVAHSMQNYKFVKQIMNDETFGNALGRNTLMSRTRR